jgi:hypothetical protein
MAKHKDFTVATEANRRRLIRQTARPLLSAPRRRKLFGLNGLEVGDQVVDVFLAAPVMLRVDLAKFAPHTGMSSDPCEATRLPKISTADT